jgi:hypothetical protein
MESIDLLEERLERLERCVFGAHYDGSTAVLLSSSQISSTQTDLTKRIEKVRTNLPLPTDFLKVYTRYKQLGLSNDCDVRTLLAAPLDVTLKIDIVLSNSTALKQMALQAKTILNLKDFISGEAWFRARDEWARLNQTEIEAAKVLAASSHLMHRVDVSLEHYDRVVDIVSEKMLMAASLNN